MAGLAAALLGGTVAVVASLFLWPSELSQPLHRITFWALLFVMALLIHAINRERDRATRSARENAAHMQGAFRREREASERLRALNEMKNSFLNAVSHELRTPLTAILGFADTLHSAKDLDPDERNFILDRLQHNAEKLGRLLTDLLDIDRLERGILEPQRRDTDLAALVARVVTEAEARSGRAVEVHAEPVVASVDAPKIERIVENLVTNAMKHTPPGTPIWVRVRSEAEGVLIVVEDAGPGVPEDLREAVFEPFRQASTLSHSPGVGIGLSLVSHFAELHAGRVWVEDRPGGGASFRVLLPQPAPDAPFEITTAASSPSQNRA
jgi:signal transduction histidine kinase